MIGDGDAGLLWLAAGLAGDRHHAGHGLDDEVVAGAGRVRSVLAEAGDRAIDEARIDLLQAAIVEPVFPEAAELEVLDHHVRGRDQPAHGLGAFGRGEVNGDGAFAAIAGMVIGGRQVLAVMAHDEGRPPFAGVVATIGALDLDDIGAEIGQQLPGPRPGQDAGKFDYADAFQRGLRPWITRIGRNRSLYQPRYRGCHEPCAGPSLHRFRTAVGPCREVIHDDVPIDLVQAFVAGFGVNL